MQQLYYFTPSAHKSQMNMSFIIVYLKESLTLFS